MKLTKKGERKIMDAIHTKIDEATLQELEDALEFLEWCISKRGKVKK